MAHVFTKSILLLVLAKAIFLCNVQGVAQAPDYWQAMTSEIDVLAVDPANLDRIYFASRDGLVGYTRDGGATWGWSSLRPQNANANVSSLAVLNGDTLAASVLTEGDDVFFRSTDGGESWTRMRFPNTLRQRPLPQGIGPGIISISDAYLSRDAGQTLDSLAVPGRKVALGGGRLLSVDISTNFGLANGATTYYSADSGITWDTVGTAVPFNDQINTSAGYKIIARSKEQFAFVFGGRRVVVLTTDGGQTFRIADPGSRNPVDLVWLDDNTIVSYSNGQEASISTDGGATWTREDDTYLPVPNGVTTRAIADGNGGILLARSSNIYRIPAEGNSADLLRAIPGAVTDHDQLVVVDDMQAFVYHDAALKRTLDGGVSWVDMPVGNTDYRPLLASSAGIWATRPDDRDLYLSTDGGTTWTFSLDLPTSGFNPIQAMFRAGETGVAVQLSGGTFVSYDNGSSWQQRDAIGVQASDGLDYAGSTSAAEWIYQFGQGNALRYQVTRDSGASFETLSTFGNQQRGAGASAVDGRMFATPSWFSNDGGANWQSYEDSTGFEDLPYRDVWFRNQRHGAYHDGDGQRGYTTFDGGQTWTSDRSMVPRAIAFRDTSTALAYDPTKGFFRFSMDEAWPEVRIEAGGVSSTFSAFAKTRIAYPNPVRAGGSICISGSVEARKAKLIGVDGRRYAMLDLEHGCAQLPPSLSAGLYVLRLENNSIRLVVK